MQWDRFALIKTVFRSHDSGGGVKKPPSKGPPPLPKAVAPAPPARTSISDIASRAATWILTPPAEQLFFQEGIDGHAESIPPDGTDSLGGAEAESKRAARTTIPPTSLDDEWLEAEEEVEDPARTQRRRAARIGTAWGMVAALAAAGVAVVLSPRSDVRSTAAPASEPRVETTLAHPPIATPTPAIPSPPVVAPTAPASVPTPTPAPAPPSPASCRSGMLPLVAGNTTCVNAAESFLCARDRRTHALRPAGCIDAKTPKAACESHGARLATSAERQQLAAAKGKTSAGAFRCAR